MVRPQLHNSNQLQLPTPTGEVAEPKPSPAPLMEITGRLKISEEQCCYVGDSFVDMQMSKAAGISAYGVATGHSSMDELREAGAVDAFSSLTELERGLEAKGDFRSTLAPP